MEEKYFIAPASISRRVVAFLIDLVVINLVIVLPFSRVFSKLIPANENYSSARLFIENNPEVMATISLIFIIIGIFVVFYFTIFEYKLQQTPGKMFLGLQLVAEKKITFWNYFFSNLTFLPVFPFWLLWIIDPFYILNSSKNQRLMERLNKILLVQKYKR